MHWSGPNLSAEACQAGSSEQLGTEGCLFTPQVDECSMEALLQQGPRGLTPLEGVSACQQVSTLLCVLRQSQVQGLDSDPSSTVTHSLPSLGT